MELFIDNEYFPKVKVRDPQLKIEDNKLAINDLNIILYHTENTNEHISPAR